MRHVIGICLALLVGLLAYHGSTAPASATTYSPCITKAIFPGVPNVMPPFMIVTVDGEDMLFWTTWHNYTLFVGDFPPLGQHDLVIRDADDNGTIDSNPAPPSGDVILRI